MVNANARELTQTVLAILAVKDVREESLQQVLGVVLRRTYRSKPVEHFEGQLERGPFERVEFRVNRDWGGGILILDVRAEIELFESDFDYQALSDVPPALDVNPNIPPEGIVAYVFGPAEKRLHLQFTARTKRLVSVAVHFGGRPLSAAESKRAELFAVKPDPKSEVRKCARCQKAEMICVRAWEVLNTNAVTITRDCICQNCGSRVRLQDPKRIRANRLTAWLMIWALFPTPVLLIVAHLRQKAWARHPLVPDAPYPQIRYAGREVRRRCRQCGQEARPVSVTRHRHLGLPAGTDTRYLCGGCKASFVVESGVVFGLFQAALLLAGGVAVILLATDSVMVRFLSGPLMLVLGVVFGRKMVQSLRVAIQNPKIS